MHPRAAYIKRQGEVNPYDNAKFREAVKQTGKKQVIIGGIPTDVRRPCSPRSLPAADPPRRSASRASRSRS